MTQSNDAALVLCELRQGVAIVTLNRPPQNRLNRPLYAELEAAVRQGVREGARCMLFRSNIDDFCLGGDFREWPHLQTHSARRERFGYSNGILNAIESLPIPTISQINGRAYGGGFEFALHTDLIIAAESARFRFTEATLGVSPLAGGVQRIAERCGRSVAARLVMLSEEITAAEALSLNIVAKVVADEQLAEVALAHAEGLAAGPTRAHAVTKSMLGAWSAGGVRGADEVMIEHVSVLVATDDVQRGVSSAIKAIDAGVARPEISFNGQ
ncbi:enoyl-CoA hydratase/isomerase [Cupriavidus basilensis OR16]|uniref:Enoyl-CoA hydratase/isomerase n=1 Tax=Cupriavidus basilensis OR16 TaxID=1127483 RepID=H1S8Z8_9BURK|nr:enoyl-CoA hydratase/isomerase family protein [Cupriavidus basilensis]EHP41014.1 enoyl-CoA hydratase/isomerase [Cupriavidus basilensis OR16]